MFNHRWDIVHALPYIKKKKALIHLTAHQLKLSDKISETFYTEQDSVRTFVLHSKLLCRQLCYNEHSTTLFFPQ